MHLNIWLQLNISSLVGSLKNFKKTFPLVLSLNSHLFYSTNHTASKFFLSSVHLHNLYYQELWVSYLCSFLQSKQVKVDKTFSQFSGVSLLFEHSPPRLNEIEHFEIFSHPKENQLAWWCFIKVNLLLFFLIS